MDNELFEFHRDVLVGWLLSGRWEFTPETQDALEAFRDCPDMFPDAFRHLLRLPVGATYADAVAKIPEEATWRAVAEEGREKAFREAAEQADKGDY